MKKMIMILTILQSQDFQEETEKKQNNDCYYMDSAMRMDDVHEFMRKSAL